MKNVQDYIDNFGMVVTNEKDGGDSCAHGMAIMYGCAVTKTTPPLNPDTYISKLESSDKGRYRRHPDQTKWYSNTNTLSRDQLTPLLCYMGLVKHPGRVALFLRHLLKCLLLTWNTRENGATSANGYLSWPANLKFFFGINIPANPTYSMKLPDLTGPEIWACWIRAFRLWPLYPLLMIFDIQTLIGCIQNRYFPSTNIQMNNVITTDFSTRIMPTPTSLLARKIYGKSVPINALNANWGDPTPMNPPVNQYLNPVIETW